jgi:mannose-6-phosphate isomerase-like protein (cupin superfamily)
MPAPDMKKLMARVARFKDLKSSSEAFVDTRIPEYNREIYNIIGRGVTENPTLAPAIADNRDFNISMLKSEPGKGSSLHEHDTIEVFIPLTGKWRIGLGDNGEEEVILEAFDIFSCPPGVMRSVKNIGTTSGCILAVLGGTNPGRVRWSPTINAKARELGLMVDEKGDLVQIK